MQTTNVTYQKVFDYFGYENQRRKLTEEVQELNDEILLYENGVGDIQNVINEIGDVLNLIQGFMVAYDIDTQEIEETADNKMERTIERIGSGYYEKRDE